MPWLARPGPRLIGLKQRERHSADAGWMSLAGVIRQAARRRKWRAVELARTHSQRIVLPIAGLKPDQIDRPAIFQSPRQTHSNPQIDLFSVLFLESYDECNSPTVRTGLAQQCDCNLRHSAVWISSHHFHPLRLCTSNECTRSLLGGFYLLLRGLLELGDRAWRQNSCRLS